MQHTHKPARRLGENLVSFFTNGDSFEELLHQANCVAHPDIIHIMKGFPISPYNHNYSLVDLEVDLPAREIVSSGGWMYYAATRELVNFVSLFPDLVKSHHRVPAFGRDICTYVLGSIPTVRKSGDGFELYLEPVTTVWTKGDATLKRERLAA